MIYLRDITREDLPLIHRWRQDPILQDSLVGPRFYNNKEGEEAWFQAYMSARDSNCRFMICLQSDGKPIGRVDLLNGDKINRSAEFQIVIGERNYQGKGYGHQATMACLDHGFSDRNLHRIYLSVLAENEPARRLYKKCFFQEEGCAREAAFKKGRYLDVIQMAVLAQEFSARDKKLKS